MNIYEVIGVVASVITVVSLLMTDFVRFRAISFTANTTWFIYGLFIASASVAVTNAILMAVNMFFLVRHLRAKEYFNIVEVRKNAVFLGEFFKAFHDEIQKFYPGFEYDPSRDVYPFFALRNVTAAGLFVLEKQSDGRLHLILDFTIPGYRDMKIGRFVYTRESEVWKKLKSLGHERVFSDHPGSKRQEKYLTSMGFRENPEGDGLVIEL